MYIALGSNLDDPPRQITDAIRAVGQLAGTQVVNAAPPRWYAPQGGPEGQADYLNTAAHLRTTLPPEALLEQLLAIERRQGRIRRDGERNSPRTIDIDILFFSRLTINLPHLRIPHPRLAERRFVLEPLAVIAGSHVHPVAKLTVAALLDRLLRGNPWRVPQEETVR